MCWNGRLIRVVLLSYHILDKKARAFLKFVCTFSEELKNGAFYLTDSDTSKCKKPPNPNGSGGQVKFTQNYFAGLFFQ